jgi:hypothetical protein
MSSMRWRFISRCFHDRREKVKPLSLGEHAVASAPLFFVTAKAHPVTISQGRQTSRKAAPTLPRGRRRPGRFTAHSKARPLSRAAAGAFIRLATRR